MQNATSDQLRPELVDPEKERVFDRDFLRSHLAQLASKSLLVPLSSPSAPDSSAPKVYHNLRLPFRMLLLTSVLGLWMPLLLQHHLDLPPQLFQHDPIQQRDPLLQRDLEILPRDPLRQHGPAGHQNQLLVNLSPSSRERSEFKHTHPLIRVKKDRPLQIFFIGGITLLH